LYKNLYNQLIQLIKLIQFNSIQFNSINSINSIQFNSILWEGIGVLSYLLINFWYTRIQASKAAIQAITVNRVGDIFISIGFIACL